MSSSGGRAWIGAADRGSGRRWRYRLLGGAATETQATHRHTRKGRPVAHRTWRKFKAWVDRQLFTDDPNLDAPSKLDLADGMGWLHPDGRVMTWAEIEDALVEKIAAEYAEIERFNAEFEAER